MSARLNIGWTLVINIKAWAKSQKGREARGNGLRFEKDIADYLRSIGFAVDLAAPVRRSWRGPGGRMVHRNIKVDFFGVLDIMAIHPDMPYFLPIQATITRGAVAKKKRDMETVEWNLSASRPQIWVKGHGSEIDTDGLNGMLVSIFTMTKSGWVEDRDYAVRGSIIKALQ